MDTGPYCAGAARGPFTPMLYNTDFMVKDIGSDFRLVRVYKSCYENQGGVLGSRWFLNIESRVWVDGGTATVIMPDMHPGTL